MPGSSRRYYFRAPTFDINPESTTSARLGSIFSRFGKLAYPLNQDEHIPIPPNSINRIGVPDFQDLVTKGVSWSAGVTASLSQILAGAVDSEMLYTFSRDKSAVYRCTFLETEEFEPSVQYVADSIAASLRVQDFIADSFTGNKKVYMITGLKIAAGFSMSTTEAGSHGPVCKVGVDASGLGFPVQAGPQLELLRTGGREVSHSPAVSKILFAYRAIKIAPKRDGELSYKDISGGQYGYGEDESEDEEEAWVIEPVEENQISTVFPDALPVTIDVQRGDASSAQ
ncbi:hypothetical protein BGZ61DRAFT_366575 [Ilyonectria robusta]|uniref:uncharacterized protein n=1 Tax=Ilyonectria robusta TaxID=1079257 RepID=UPI001E8CA1D3|nr:uncharacterized protein BGZ61DRAFT_366575 [Ilyonectria robusta]KAH8665488.1 hypothetical protein BGZ61DRAFT_366575 [Ilyonectria robusta]